MKMREIVFLSLICVLTAGGPAGAQEAPRTSLPMGNALANSVTLENVVRSVVAQVIDADVVGTGIHIRTDAIFETVSIPSPQILTQSILSALGIKNELLISLSPIVTDIELPRDQLKVTVTNLEKNRFQVRAQWSLSQFSTRIDRLSITIPKGLFEQDLTIDSQPIVAELKPDSEPIEFELDFEAELSATGAKIHLGELKTNLMAEARPEFGLKLGPLTVEGRPLSISIVSQGKTLIADEAQIREELQNLEPTIVDSLRKSMVEYINAEIKKASQTIEETPPVQYSVNTNTLLSDADLSPDLKALFGGVDIHFIFSYLQKINSLNLFSGQVSTEICFDNQCLLNTYPSNQIDSADVTQVSPDGGSGILIYESFLKTTIESEPFQKRIRIFFQKANDLTGVSIGPSGVKIGLVPTLNSVATVLNLEINIGKTANSETHFGNRLRTKFGGLIERIFGAGRIIRIPIEILFHLDGIESDASGSRFIVVTPRLPFDKDGGFSYPRTCSLKDCPSNLEDMTNMVKKSFLETIYDEIQELIPLQIRIPLNKPIVIRGLEYIPKGIRVTPHHGLLMTSEIIHISEKGIQ